MNFNKLARECVRKLKPYSCARDEYKGSAGIFLDANENSFGSVLSVGLNRYPDPRQIELKARIAAIKETTIERTFLGNGSDEVIDLLVRVFCEPGVDKIMILPPTYGMYKVVADINSVEVVEVPLTENYQIDTDAVLKNTEDVKLVFVCSPNNPTGNIINDAAILKLLETFNGLVVIDEAYMDFAPEKSWLPKLNQFPNLVIIQTFSKAWGLAGIRMGMGFADPEIIDLLTRIKYPYNVSGATQQLALEALSHIDKKDKMVANILSERQKLIEKLKKLDIVLKVNPTDSNFILVKFRNAKQVFEYLMDKRIIVRNRSSVIGCENSLRITVGKPEENKILIETLKKFTAECTEIAEK